MFKVGDKVRRITESKWPDLYGHVGEVYTVKEVRHNTGGRNNGKVRGIVVGEGGDSDISNFELVREQGQLQPGDRVVTRSYTASNTWSKSEKIFLGSVDDWCLIKITNSKKPVIYHKDNVKKAPVRTTVVRTVYFNNHRACATLDYVEGQPQWDTLKIEKES